MKINNLHGTIADRPIDSHVIQDQHFRAGAQTRNPAMPPVQRSLIDRIAAMLNYQNPSEADYWIDDIPTYDKGTN